MPESTIVTTSDNLKIAADVYPSDGDKYAILLHMMPATKESWQAFAKKLQDAGYTSIAIDERGHGESKQGGDLDYKLMPEAQQQAKIRDVEAAFAYLKEQYGATDANTVVIGASIGANLAIQFLSRHPQMPVGIALSPGLDYRGVKTEEPIRHLSDGQTCILVASDDDELSFKTVRKLHDMNADHTILIQKSGLGHGTNMTDADPALTDRLIDKLP